MRPYSTPFRRRATSPCLLHWLVAVLLGLAAPLHAIVIRHDQPDESYRVAASDYPEILPLHQRRGKQVCVGTLIAPRWVITAAHCSDDTPIRETVAAGEAYELSIAGERYRVDALVLHPDYRATGPAEAVDLALLRLDRRVTGITPATLYDGDDEAGQVVQFVGWGFTGIGSMSRRGNDGRLRRAHNRILEAGRWLTFRFDDPGDPRQSPLPLEGVPGLGDSGGPALLERRGRRWLLGVAVGELLAAPPPDPPQGLYGATLVYERISRHRQWIESHIRREADF